MTSFTMRIVNNIEEWNFRTNYQTREGNKRQILPFLWGSEVEASEDVSLFQFFKNTSRKTKTSILLTTEKPVIPIAPDNLTWFVDVKPDASWLEIRNYLASLQNNLPPADVVIKRPYTSLKNLSRLNNYNNKHQKMNHKVNEEEHKGNNEEEAIEMIAADPSNTTPSITQIVTMYLDSQGVGPMRRDWTGLGPQRQNIVQKAIVRLVENAWNVVAPNQSRSELDSCLKSSSLNIDNQISALSGIRNSFKLYVERKDKESQIQEISKYVQENTREKVSEMLGINPPMSAYIYRTAHHHASVYGPGQPGESMGHERNVEEKIIIALQFVDYLIAQG